MPIVMQIKDVGISRKEPREVLMELSRIKHSKK
jgi:hypothetical protein